MLCVVSREDKRRVSGDFLFSRCLLFLASGGSLVGKSPPPAAELLRSTEFPSCSPGKILWSPIITSCVLVLNESAGLPCPSGHERPWDLKLRVAQLREAGALCDLHALSHKITSKR